MNDYFKFSIPESVLREQVSCDETLFSHRSVEGVRAVRHFLRDGVSAGVEVWEISNADVCVWIVPTRGMGIWKVCVKNGADEIRVGWNSPVRDLINPQNVPLFQPDGLGWLRGFNELVARCGLEWNGAPQWDASGNLQFPLHGMIQNTPARALRLEFDDEKREIRLSGVVREARLFFNALELTSTLTLPYDGATFRTTDVVENTSAAPGELELLYHINVGNPVADEGARAFIPFKRCAPRNDTAAAQMQTRLEYLPPQVGRPETCYYYDLAADENGDTAVFLQNPTADFGVALDFNKKEFPCFCQWKCEQARDDGYVTGLEPAINFPNNRDFEKAHGRVARLESKESRAFHLCFSFRRGADEVAREVERINALQALSPSPILETKPLEDWAN
ncbi:MAG: aldose 1-epimerase family protein [Planctomycetia bacterium]|nr:aldose 1-epimerase family protein [Planctomycetia bacterium]